MKFDFENFRSLFPAAALTLGLTAMPVIADGDDGDEPPGVPHIKFEDSNGSDVAGGDLEVEFELIPGVVIDGVPTQTIFLPFNNSESAFVSNPVGGLGDGLLNDDTGFEAEDAPLGFQPAVGPFEPADIVVTLDSSTLSDPSMIFTVLLGDEVITNLTQTQLDDAGTGFTKVDSFSLGNGFDDHPLFSILETNPSFIGEVSLLFNVTDINGTINGIEDFGIILTTDPAAAIVPEPATAALLALGVGVMALRRRVA